MVSQGFDPPTLLTAVQLPDFVTVIVFPDEAALLKLADCAKEREQQ